MSPNLYFELYSLLVNNNTDTDQAECLLSDLEDAMKKDSNIDPYEYLNEIS
tara:strand:+ start:485 stop:637 length:153 start_codon:yes stop_codon:yes gene_type:complete